MAYYWIVVQHSGKVLEVEGSSVNNFARIIQYSKKSENNPSVDNQLWSFNGGFITNKNSGLVLNVTDGKIEKGTRIVQFEKHAEPAINQKWEYNYDNSTISLRADRNFVLEVPRGFCHDGTDTVLNTISGHTYQRFILQKWNNNTTSSEKFGRLVTSIIDYNKFLPKLSQNLLENLDDQEYYDIAIEVGDDPYIKIFRAHMVILNCRSPYLRRILSTNKKKNEDLVHIKLPNILPETFQIILRYIYGGRLSLEEYDTSDIIKILVAAGELSLQELITYIQSFLIENRAYWMEQNFIFIYQTSFENDSFLELQKYCTDLMNNQPHKIFKSSNFTLIPEKLLISLIQNGNLQMNGIQVWEHVLKWGLAQNPKLPPNSTSFSKDNFNSLKNTLQQCIPSIKFFDLTSKEFFDKVLPYKKVLPKELYKDLLKNFLDHDSNNPIKKSELNLTKDVEETNSNYIDTKIITFQHAELISKWIDRLKITGLPDMVQNSYKFNLLFRGSRDGFYPEKFHEICDNQSRTVIIVRVKGSSEILGGYNPIKWRSDATWGATKDSFIFSFKNNSSIENHILSRVMDENNAIDNRSFCGLSFGDGDLTIWGFDLNTLGSYCRSSKTSYEKPIRETDDRFSVEECEVFRLMLAR